MEILQDAILPTILILSVTVNCVAFAQDANKADQEVPLREPLSPSNVDKQSKNGADTKVVPQGNFDGPITSPDLRPDSLYIPPVGTVLKGAAEIESVQGKVVVLKASPVANYRGPHLKFFELHFKNASDQVAIVDADNTQAMTHQGLIHHANASVVIKNASNNLTPKGKALVTGVSLMSLGLAGPIFYEMMTPDQHAKRYLGHAVGIDGVRHDVEVGRFGRRLIMPGDESTGWIAFECSDSESIKSLKIPIWFAPMRSPATYLNLPVAQGANL